MADEFTDAGIAGARGAFAFAAAEWSDDELRLGAKALQDLEQQPSWQLLMRMVERRREVAVQQIIHASPRDTTAAEYAAVGGQAEALDWIRFAPAVVRQLAQERDEQNKAALEQAQGGSERS